MCPNPREMQSVVEDLRLLERLIETTQNGSFLGSLSSSGVTANMVQAQRILRRVTASVKGQVSNGPNEV